jgi:hypothetical protein
MRRELVLMAILASCSSEPKRVLTNVVVELPPGDGAAEEALDRTSLRVIDEAGACAELATWLSRRCDGEVVAPPALWESSASVQSLGRAESIEIDANGDGPWEIAARGEDAGGTAFLYGCATATPGQEATVRLWRAWDDVDVCAGQFHPACPVYVDCADSRAQAVGSPGQPVCKVAGAAAEGGTTSWEEAGVACPPDGGSYPLPCRPAVVSCAPGALDPIEDGACPQPRDARECTGSFADDLNCDGTIPTCPDDPGDPCVPGAPCGGDSSCGTTVCNDDDTADCTRPREECNGTDDDCDGVADDADPDALGWCNARRAIDTPRADGCLRGACSCAEAPACRDGEHCCEGQGCQAIDVACRETDRRE